MGIYREPLALPSLLRVLKDNNVKVMRFGVSLSRFYGRFLNTLPEGIKGAVATALTIFYGMQGKDKEYTKNNVLKEYYPDWSEKTFLKNLFFDIGFLAWIIIVPQFRRLVVRNSSYRDFVSFLMD